MKNIKQVLGITMMSLALAVTYAYANSAKGDNAGPIVAQAFANADRPANNTVKIALLLDTSNSMDGLINQAKSQLWDIVNKFSHAKCGNGTRPNLKIALYQYGNDALSAKEGYIEQVLDFSADLDEISEKLFSLTTNGGEEYCGNAIQTCLKQLDWGKNPDHLKMMFIAGNEPFTQGKPNYVDAVTNAKEKNIIVNTIFCGNYEQGIHTKWKNGATLAGGEYVAIDHNEHIVHIDTPYDAKIIRLNEKLNATYVSYGPLGRAKYKAQATQDANAYEMEQAIAIKRAVSKSSRLYNNASWDLVDALDDVGYDVSKIKKEQLPEELRNESETALKNHIANKKTVRTKIQKEIRDLNSKRDAFISKNQKESNSGELKNAMLNAIEKQALTKNYTWE